MQYLRTCTARAAALALGGGLLGSVALAQNAVPRAGAAAPQAKKHESLHEVVRTLRSRNGQPSAEAARVSIDPNGFLRYLGAPPGTSFAPPVGGQAPEAVAQAFLRSCERLLGTGAAEADFVGFRTRSAAGGRTVLKFQQTFGGIPVFGSMAVVQLDSETGIESLLSDVARDTDGLRRALGLLGSVRSSAEIVAATVELLEPVGGTLETTEPSLLFFAPEVLGASGDATLVWEFETRGGSPDIDRRFLVDAVLGDVVRNYPLCLTALDRQIYDSNNSTANPGTLLRVEGQGPTGNGDVDAAYTFFGDTYSFYLARHGRDSINGAGSTLSATVRYCAPSEACPYPNAFWNGARMYFGQGMATDDVTAHELTHGVTQYESGLLYENHSGAINESFSDVWGEFVDLTNPGLNVFNWVIAEETPLGIIRLMNNPPFLGDPDRLGSPLFIPPVPVPNEANDYGGVHSNSGVNNKLCYLLTSGGTFNGKTVSGLGIPTVADLYYEAQVNLLMPASNYSDLSNALEQAAVNLGWTVLQRGNLDAACQAVEIGSAGAYIFVDLANAGSENGTPAQPFNTVAEGLAALQAGGHLAIQSGSYDEQVTMSVLSQVIALGGPVIIGQ